MSDYRTERCVCGGIIRAPSLHASGEFVREHNLTGLHLAWRSWRVMSELALELVPSGLPDYDDPRRERPTADQASRDLSGERARASAVAVEGQS